MPEADLTPRVSVIIPTRNRAAVIGRSIESVLGQTVESLEVLVIDDASDDETERVVTAINDSRIRYVKCDRHRGAPAARNTGIRLARGHYLAFHDSDDEWLPTKLEHQLSLIEQRAPLAGVVTCGTIRVDPDGQERTSVPATETLPYRELLAYSARFWSGPTIVVKRTPETRQLLFDESLPAGEDWDYVVRLAQVTEVVSVRQALVRIGRADGERVSRYSRNLAGRKLLRAKHENELRRDRRALIAHEIGIGRLSISCGEYTEARRRLVTALRLSPFQPRLVATVIGSFLTQSAVMRRIFGRRPRTVREG